MTRHLTGKFIKQVSLFRNLTHDEIQQLLDASEEVGYPAGRAIFDAGEESRALYVVIDGEVRISLAAPMTEDTAECQTDVRVIRLRRSRYRELLKSDNLAAYKLAANAADLLGERLQQTDEWIGRMLQGRRDAELISKWKQFRQSLSREFSHSPGGFSP